jgi:hypothetical protein
MLVAIVWIVSEMQTAQFLLRKSVTTYVDQPIFRKGKKLYCHLYADSIKELHEFAEKLGIKRCWYENKRGKNFPHYDITESQRITAIIMGAQEVKREHPSQYRLGWRRR